MTRKDEKNGKKEAAVEAAELAGEPLEKEPLEAPDGAPMGGADPDACGKDFGPQLQADIDRLRAENAALEKTLAERDAQIETLNARIFALEREVKMLEEAGEPIDLKSPGAGGAWALLQRERGSVTVAGCRLEAQKPVELKPEVLAKLDPKALPVALYPTRAAAESALAEQRRRWAAKKKKVA